MSYINIVAGAFIDYRNGRWNYERRQDHLLEWRQVRTFEHLLLSDREMQKLIRTGELRLYNGDGKPPAEGQASRVHGQREPSDLDWEEAGRRLMYVQAIHDADLFRPGTAVSDWDHEIEHVFATHGSGWTELRGKRRGGPACRPNYRSVRRWVTDGGRKPTQRKLLPKNRFKGNYSDRLPNALRKFIHDRVEKHYLRRPAITLDMLKTIIHVELKTFNEKRVAAGESVLDPPGDTAIQSSIESVPKDEVLRRRYGDMAAFLEYGSAEAQEDPEAPLDRVELDATPCDLFVVDPDTGLPIGRPTLVVAIDRCTRMILGWFVTFEKPSVLALMQCLRHAILSKDYLDEMREKHGWAIENECEAFGVPRVLRVDRGRENIAEHLARFAVRAGISRVEITAGKKPWLKGAVERVIKTISERVFHPTQGTTFHNVLMRMGYNPQTDAVCTPADLDYALHKFFIDVYPFEQRRSLNNRQAIAVWRDKTRNFPVESIGSIEQVAHLFGRTEFAKPGRHGIHYENMQYFSSELLALLTNAQFKHALADQGGKIEFHVDPGDLSQIHVRLPHLGGQTLIVPVAPKWTRYATGLSIWHHRRIREYASEEARGDAEALLQAKYDLMEITKGTGLAKRGGLRARGMSARMEGLMRSSRAGTDARTTPDVIADTPVSTFTTATTIPPNEVSHPSAANDPIVTTSVPPASDDSMPPSVAETDIATNEGQAVRRHARKGYRP
jgi:putative transposase